MRHLKKFLIAVLIFALLFALAGCMAGLGGVTGLAQKPIADFRELAASFRERLGREAAERAEPEVAVLPERGPDSWELRLVNFENPLEADFEPPLAENADMYLFDSRACSALDEFLAAGRAAGYPLALTSAYRTYNYQAALFEDKVRQYIDGGMEREAAEGEAATSVARPGTSEHQLGLAADIVSENYPYLESGFEASPDALWLRENCADYGFVIRYAGDKTHITGIIDEPWHFRYVGVEAARFMTENNLCLEEFLDLYE